MTVGYLELVHFVQLLAKTHFLETDWLAAADWIVTHLFHSDHTNVYHLLLDLAEVYSLEFGQFDFLFSFAPGFGGGGGRGGVSGGECPGEGESFFDSVFVWLCFYSVNFLHDNYIAVIIWTIDLFLWVVLVLFLFLCVWLGWFPPSSSRRSSSTSRGTPLCALVAHIRILILSSWLYRPEDVRGSPGRTVWMKIFCRLLFISPFLLLWLSF